MFGNVRCGVREEVRREMRGNAGRRRRRGKAGLRLPEARPPVHRAEGGSGPHPHTPSPEPDELLLSALSVARPGRGQGLREAGGESGLQAGLAGAKFKFRGSPERTWWGEARVGPPAPTSTGIARG